jgi:uncharacterized protein (DUF1697 family)
MRYVAFLRGINVGGHRATSAQLCAPFSKLGFTEPATFLASGNVIFDANAMPIVPDVEQALAATLGYDVPTFILTSDQVSNHANALPFPRQLARCWSGDSNRGALDQR